MENRYQSGQILVEVLVMALLLSVVLFWSLDRASKLEPLPKHLKLKGKNHE